MQPGRKANHSPPSSAKVKNGWSYTSTPLYVFMAWCLVKYGIYVFTAWCLVKYRDNFTFTLLAPHDIMAYSNDYNNEPCEMEFM
jgi:hypothetical protein